MFIDKGNLEQDAATGRFVWVEEWSGYQANAPLQKWVKHAIANLQGLKLPQGFSDLRFTEARVDHNSTEHTGSLTVVLGREQIVDNGDIRDSDTLKDDEVRIKISLANIISRVEITTSSDQDTANIDLKNLSELLLSGEFCADNKDVCDPAFSDPDTYLS